MVSEGVTDMGFEMYDPYIAFMPSLDWVDPDDPPIPVYKYCQQQLLECVDETLGAEDRVVMSLFRFTYNRQEMKTAIVVIVAAATVGNWKQPEDEMRDFLPDDSYIPIEFVPYYIDIHDEGTNCFGLLSVDQHWRTRVSQQWRRSLRSGRLRVLSS